MNSRILYKNSIIQIVLIYLFFGFLSLGLFPRSVMAQKEKVEGMPGSYRSQLTQMEPDEKLMQAVEAFKKKDPNARFTWFRGHVNSFSTAPKKTVSSYSLSILEKNGLSTATHEFQWVRTTTTLNVGGDWDSEFTKPLPYPGEEPANGHSETKLPADKGVISQNENVIIDNRPAPRPQKMGTILQKNERKIAKQILRAFFKQHNDVFKLEDEQIQNGLPNLKLVRYGIGEFSRRMVFQQYVNNLPILDGKTIVLLDLNWNVTNISRQIATKQKLQVNHNDLLKKERILKMAVAEVSQKFKVSLDEWEIKEARRGIDVIRGIVAWKVRAVASGQDFDLTIKVHGRTGEILNISDNIDRYTDAKLKRWAYSGGDFTEPYEILSTNIFTQNDDTLEHNFFYMANDEEEGGNGTCTETSPNSKTTPPAYGTTNGNNYIRPTIRPDRDFSLWNPKSAKGRFGEGQVYYWARAFVLWLKESLDANGVLPASTSDYPKVLIIVNACDDGAGVHKSSFDVTTLDNKGEGTNTILLPERCRKGNANCHPSQYDDSNSGHQYTYLDNGGYHAPGVVHHELNHFILRAYYDVDATLECSQGVELKYLHEGGPGRTIPQMFWHHYYNVGYAPLKLDETLNSNKLFQSDDPSGKPHQDTGDINTLVSWQCGPNDKDDPNYVNPYQAGGVVAQPLWEIYHGKKVESTDILSMARPAEDLGMLKSTYWALDMVSGSIWKDRWEMANRFMEYWEQYSSAASSTKSDWCDVWEHHGLRTYIDTLYCS